MVIRHIPKAVGPCILEVERKFSALAVRELTQHGGIPPFKTLASVPSKTIHDTYYDNRANALSSAGTWVRRRNGIWEAKIRKGGDFTNSRFEEVDSVGAIADCVRRITGLRADETEDFGLHQMARFTTTRDAWLADGEFQIVRDRMDFGHEVGEVELSATLESIGGKAPSEVEKQAKMQEMDERISEFMGRYAWAFAEGKPVGKLTAYFEMVRRRS